MQQHARFLLMLLLLCAHVLFSMDTRVDFACKQCNKPCYDIQSGPLRELFAYGAAHYSNLEDRIEDSSDTEKLLVSYSENRALYASMIAAQNTVIEHHLREIAQLIQDKLALEHRNQELIEQYKRDAEKIENLQEKVTKLTTEIKSLKETRVNDQQSPSLQSRWKTLLKIGLGMTVVLAGMAVIRFCNFDSNAGMVKSV